MPIIESTIRVKASAEDLFALSQDYGLRTAWDPFTKEMRFLNGATEAKAGAQVWVRAWNGLTMTVEYTSVKPPRSVAMKMIRGPFLFEKFAGTWLYEENVNGETDVTFRYSHQTRGRWLRWLLQPMVSWLLKRDVNARLCGLKKSVEEENVLKRLGQLC